MRETTPTNTHPAKQAPATKTLLTGKELAQFKKLASREYGVTLTDKQARFHASALLIIVGAIVEIYFAFRCLIGSNTKGDRKR